MAHFFLFSGSEGSHLHWQSCKDLLTARGHLTSTFGWSDLPWDKGVDQTLSYLNQTLAGAVDPVLVGHSAAGLLIPRLLPSSPVLAEIYIAALAPQPGHTFLEQMFETPTEIFDPAWLESAYQETSLEAKILHTLYDVPFSEYVPRKRLYLVCEKDREIRPEWQTYAAIHLLKAECRSLKAGHYGHVTHTHEVCQAMTDFVGNFPEG